MPPAVFVNEDLEIIHTRGKFDRYFKMPPGRPSLNILKMALDDLTLPLQSAIVAAKKEKRPVRRKGVTVSVSQWEERRRQREIVSFEVTPLKSAMNEPCFMIVFLEEAPLWSRGKSAGQIPCEAAEGLLDQEAQETGAGTGDGQGTFAIGDRKPGSYQRGVAIRQ